MRLRYVHVARFVQIAAAALACQLAAGQACTVGPPPTGTSLVDCLRNEAVTDIQLQGDYAVGSTFEQYETQALKLCRNVTIQGPGRSKPLDAWPVLDLGFVDGVVDLCGTASVTLKNLVLKNERQGSGAAFDFFTGQPGSRVGTINTYRLRQACTPSGHQLRALSAYRRSPVFPNSTQAQQTMVEDVTYKGKVYKDAVCSMDVTYDVPLGVDEGKGNVKEGGYALMAQNCVRLCDSFISKECLASKSADACVMEILDRSTATPPRPPGLGAATAAAILVPVCAGFLLAAGFATWWLKRRCRRSKQSQPGPADEKPYISRRHSRGGAGAGGAPSRGGSETSSSTESSAGPCLARPFAAGIGWEVVDSKTSPLLGPVEDSPVELGALLGSGSFGKVYRGRWSGMDVAVKVIEHSGTTAAAVQHEMEMMMSFQHDNIVRALHSITYMHKDIAESEYSCSTTLSRFSSLPSNASFTQVRPLHTSKMWGSFTTTRRVGSGLLPMHTAAALAGAAADASTGAGASPAQPDGASASAGDGGAGMPAGQTACLGRCRSGSSIPSSVVGGSDAVLTIAEGSSCCCGSVPSCQCGCSAGSLPSGVQVHVEAHSCVKAAAGSACGASCASLVAPGDSAAVGSSGGSSRHILPCLSDSLGSSVDCRCVADLQLRGAKSFKEPERRYESWLVLDYCDHGSLSNYMSHFPPPSASPCSSAVQQLLLLLKDTAQGLQELHQQQVVHGDLNARNVLVASTADGGVQAKLADLGLSRSILKDKRHRTTNTVGTMSHMPPEMLQSGCMSVAADVYALGIMMWELYTGEDAFQRLQHPGQFFETVVLQDLRPVIPHGMPANYQLLMQHCWATDLEARPTISRVLECLEYMLQERQQQRLAGPAASAERQAVSAPLPLLLQSPPPRKQQHWWQHQNVQRLALLKVVGSEGSSSPMASAAGLQAFSSGSSFLVPGAVRSAQSSNLLLPVLDVGEPASAADEAQQQQHQQHAPPGYVSQPLPAACAGPGASFSFYRRSRNPGATRPSVEVQSCTAREDSGTHHSQSTSSGKLHTLFQSLRQGSFTMRDISFSSSRGTSWSARQNSQTGSMGDHPWFV